MFVSFLLFGAVHPDILRCDNGCAILPGRPLVVDDVGYLLVG